MSVNRGLVKYTMIPSLHGKYLCFQQIKEGKLHNLTASFQALPSTKDCVGSLSDRADSLPF